jgi:iron(III) transport system ATP-binding protein
MELLLLREVAVMSVEIRIKHAVKKYGNQTIINDLNLDVKEGEFFTLLGPSGCGKTTLLRMIAGFNTIEGGDFYFNDNRINDLDPSKRNIGMVFQNYAIFPNMTVRKNVEFGLKNQKISKEEIASRANEFLKLMQIDMLADRMPERLSGGQQQRVALARAIVTKPRVLLFDEPLSNLDAKLRDQMRTEIRRIQQQFGITSIYVTHDQDEAMTVSDRIMVMDKGRIQQLGTPFEIYSRPTNHFVADFIGRANFFSCMV